MENLKKVKDEVVPGITIRFNDEAEKSKHGSLGGLTFRTDGDETTYIFLSENDTGTLTVEDTKLKDEFDNLMCILGVTEIEKAAQDGIDEWKRSQNKH